MVPLLYARELPASNFEFIITAIQKQVNSVLSKVDGSGRHYVRVQVLQFLSTEREYA